MCAKQTQLEAGLQSLPAVMEVEIDMEANSTTAVIADVSTGLQNGQAWEIYWMDYQFENEDPAVETSFIDEDPPWSWSLELQRGDDNTGIRGLHDNRVLLGEKFGCVGLLTGAAGAHSAALSFPRRIRPMLGRNYTSQPTLQVVFDTFADIVKISAATIHLVVTIVYRVITAPTNIVNQLGIHGML